MTPEPRRGFLLAPLQVMLVTSLLLLLAVATSAWVATRLPWVGAGFTPVSGGLEVAAVHPEGPLAGRLEPGERVLALSAAGERWPLSGYRPLLNPHALPDYHAYNAYLDFQGELARALARSPVRLWLADGRTISFAPADARPLTTLPAGFWWLHLFGIVACLIGMFVRAFRRENLAALLLALSGAGFYLATWFHAIWRTRELALPEGLFELLLRGNHLGLHLMLGALLTLLAVYPRPFRHQLAWLWSIALLVVAIQLNENLQLWNWPLHSFYLPLLLYYLAGVALALLQWYRARRQPLDRAALRWVFLSVLMSMGVGMVVYFLPLIFSTPPLIGIVGMVGLAVTLYLGFALGVLRHRLFELERWWFMAWAWFLGGLSVLLVDAAVMSLFGVGPLPALGLAVIAVGWVYFPVRQWLWRQLAASSEIRMERQLPGFVEALFTSTPEEQAEIWRDLLRRVYQPLSMEKLARPPAAPRLAGNGARLEVPSLESDGFGGLRLLYGQGGRRLYSRRDREVAEALVAIATRVRDVRRAREEGAETERQRIKRDLHDDVGGRLLTLLHTAEGSRQREMARGALHALREALHALDERRRYSLPELAEEAREEIEERLAPHAVRLDWRQEGMREALLMTPRQFINLRRVMSEAVTNALRHARPDCLRVALCHRHGWLRLSVANDRSAPEEVAPMADGHAGRGLNNMETRIRELGGELWLRRHQEQRGRWFAVEASVPLSSSGSRPAKGKVSPVS